jgi:hypothetical protein
MKFSLARFVLTAVFAFLFTLSAWAQTQAGQIKIARAENQVEKELADGTRVPLKNGDLVTESDTVVTGKNSSVVLVFMNGSSVKLGADSKLGIDEFKMDPLADPVTLSGLKEEPSVSKTALNLAFGEMVGDVKKLNKSSSYSIKTPVGAAGIRGTIYRIVYKPTSDGKAFFTVSTAEGLVVMTGLIDGEIPIPPGQEVVVEVDIPAANTPPGTPATTANVVTTDIPEATKTLINTATTLVAAAVQETVITPTPPTGGTPPTPPPAATPPSVTLTPGAGG